MKLLTSLFIIVSIFLIGCEESSSSFSYEKKIVVNGLLESYRSIDTLKLLYTGEVDRAYDPASYAIPNALVIVSGVDVAFVDTLIYDPANPGRYHTVDSTKIIQPTKTYRLEVRTQDGNSVSAVTTVPDTFSIVYSSIVNNSTVRYSTSSPVNFFAWTPSRFYGIYLPTISSLDSNAARIPKSFITDTTSNPPPFKIGYRVGLPKEQNYTELPWIFLSYYGTIRFDVIAVDENYGNFINKYATTQGGELKEIGYNVQGGLGFFGSRTVAKGSITVYLTP